MPLNYLSKSSQFFWILFLGLSFLIFGILVFLFFGLIYAGILVLYRKKPMRPNEAVITKSNILFSPVNGEIKSIRSKVDHPIFGKDLIEVQIVIPWWREWGLFLPANLQVIDRVYRPEKAFFRYGSFLKEGEPQLRDQGHFLSLGRSGGDEIGLHFVRCLFGGSAQINLYPGDKGKLGARFGFFPWGGTALLYLPGNYEILLNTGEQIVAGESPLATEL